MEPTFRASMNWLHSWAGVVLGGVLFAIFWMGSLAVFDREIDRWMAPMTRLAPARHHISFDSLRPLLEAAMAAKAPTWRVILPTERDPTLHISYRDGDNLRTRYIDSATGAELPNPGTLAGRGFIYPFHYMLHIRFAELGMWLVGLAGMTMLAMCVSGVVIHRKIFTDFFTFRPRRRARRVLLDLHNVAGVLGLPFHIAITLSGLIIFAAMYFPSGMLAAYKDATAFNAAVFGIYSREASGMAGGSVASLDAMVAKAERIWNDDAPNMVQIDHLGDMAAFASVEIRHLGDKAAYVRIRRTANDRVTAVDKSIWFDLATGRVLHKSAAAKRVMTAWRFIAGMHFIEFRHWTLRWLYFGLGLSGCALIATGYLFWLESRRKKHGQLGRSGVRIVESLAVGSTTGIIVATLAFFVANRLLPLGTTFAGYERAALEIWAFYLVWLGTFAHAWLCPRAWTGQCQAIAVFALTAVLLNWITTGDHLIRSLVHAYLWPVAGMDLTLLTGALIAAFVARKLQGQAEATSAHPIPAREARLHPME